MSKKDQILETALSLFDTYNYSTIGIDRIIEESNVAKMTFYKYFPSKESLIYECLLFRSSSLKSKILLELENQDQPLAQLKKIYDWHIDWFNSDDFCGCMFQKAMLDTFAKYPSVIEPIIEYRRWLHETISIILEKMQIHNSSMSDIFIFILDGMTMQNKVDNSTIDSHVHWEYILKIINFELKE